MVEVHKTTRRHRVVHRKLHHDPAKKQEILDKVDAAILKEEPKKEAESPSVDKTVEPAAQDKIQTPAAPIVISSVPDTSGGTTFEPVASTVQSAPSVSSVAPSAASSENTDLNQSQTIEPSSVPPATSPAKEPESLSGSILPPSGQPTTSQESASAGQAPAVGQSSEEAVAPPWRADDKANVPQEDSGGSLKKKLLTIFLFVVIIIASVGGGYMIYSKVLRKEPLKTSETEQFAPASQNTGESAVSPTQAPSSTPKLVDLTKYSIKVLNGSGIRGEAAKGQQILESMGFTVASIGNAPSSDYLKTVIQVKKNIDDSYLAKLKEVIGKYYVLSGVQEIPEDETAEVVVILGNTKAE